MRRNHFGAWAVMTGLPTPFPSEKGMSFWRARGPPLLQSYRSPGEKERV